MEELCWGNATDVSVAEAYSGLTEPPSIDDDSEEDQKWDAFWAAVKEAEEAWDRTQKDAEV